MAENLVLFDDDGSFKTATIMSEAQGSLQVEQASGKRSKIKQAQIYMRFAAPGVAELLPKAQILVEELDLDFLWECAPQDEFDFKSLAADYFGHVPSAVESTALLMRLQAAPMYFYRKGRGLYKPAPPETLKAALAAVEKKRLAELQVAEFSDAMVAGKVPDAIRCKARSFIFRPDKNSIEYRALDKAAQQLNLSHNHLLLQSGVFSSPRDLMQARFLAEHFARGAGFDVFPLLPASGINLDDLPLADARAFSIDDSSTTEIDDCLSVSPADGGWRIGVHIAAPGVAIGSGESFDLAARDRMSTVYMPGEKITMLPDSAVAAYSLDQGTVRPVLSIYALVDEACSTVINVESALERVLIAANLRHDQLDDVITEAFIESSEPAITGTPVDEFASDLRVLWRLMLTLCAQREKVRGKPEPRFRSDFHFAVNNDSVAITQRRRDAPLDRIVAEMMIFANSQWGLLLAQNNTPGIYRSQTMGRVKMTTHPVPHQGLGVAQYMWGTSPLRRYTDLVNQRQLIAVLAKTPPPFAPKATELFSVISAFDAKYDAYNEHQQTMERYWCLRWLQQEHGDDAPEGRHVQAVIVRDDLLRLAHAPFYFKLTGVPELAAGRRVWVEWIAVDELTLMLEARYIGLDEVAGEIASDELESLTVPELSEPVPDLDTDSEIAKEISTEISTKLDLATDPITVLDKA